MVFSSFTFLAVFLPVFLAVYFLVPDRMVHIKNTVLLASSLLFYAAGEPVWVLVLLFSGMLDYVIGLFITGCQKKWQSKALLLISLCGNLGFLFVFKYLAFVLSQFGIHVTILESLPIGISFYTFQTMSYTIDLYKGQIKPQRNLVAFLSYVSMFPQLVAGPIIRYADIEDRLVRRNVTLDGFSIGITRFAGGLGKKIILANYAGKLAAELLGMPPQHMSTTGVWFGSLMFMFQIYFDFSGYSDMAIGLGRMIGFEFKENFDYPYTAKSITDFWRRWHISLSSFFRDYVYIPLGGNRRHQIRNLLIVWAITGLWHGASWNFVLWGLYFSIILIVEKYLLSELLAKAPVLLARLYSLSIVLFGWVIFYYTDLASLTSASAKFFGFAEQLTDFRTTEMFFANLAILPVFVLFSTTIPSKVFSRLVTRFPSVEATVNAALMLLCITMLVGQTFNPFLYFRF